MTAPSTLSDRQLRELLLQTFLEVQREEQEKGVLPSADHTVTARYRRLFEYAGAILLGLFIASTCVFVVFIVTRVLLHVDFSRYASV